MKEFKMDKKISEMTNEELQDYALKLEQDKTILNSSIEKYKTDYAELELLNKNLQKRNNALFVQLEQQHKPTTDQNNQDQEPKKTSFEDVNNLLMKELK